VWSFVAVAVALVLNAAQSPSQQPKMRQLRGHVLDAAGAIIQGASVFVRRTIPPAENVRLLAHTDIHGDFKLMLPEGGYDVLIASPGFASGFKTVPVLTEKDKRVVWKLGPLDCSFPGINCDTFQ